MKSLKQMQCEILERARWDGGYPRAVVMGMGCIALAYTPEEFASMNKTQGVLMAIYAGGLLIPPLALACFILFK